MLETWPTRSSPRGTPRRWTACCRLLHGRHSSIAIPTRAARSAAPTRCAATWPSCSRGWQMHWALREAAAVRRPSRAARCSGSATFAPAERRHDDRASTASTSSRCATAASRATKSASTERSSRPLLQAALTAPSAWGAATACRTDATLRPHRTRNYGQYRRPDPRIAACVAGALGDSRQRRQRRRRDRLVRARRPAGGCGGAVDHHDSTAAAERSPRSCRRARGDLPVRDAASTAALAILTLHHWPDCARGLHELARRRPAGRAADLGPRAGSASGWSTTTSRRYLRSTASSSRRSRRSAKRSAAIAVRS